MIATVAVMTKTSEVARVSSLSASTDDKADYTPRISVVSRVSQLQRSVEIKGGLTASSVIIFNV